MVKRDHNNVCAQTALLRHNVKLYQMLLIPIDSITCYTVTNVDKLLSTVDSINTLYIYCNKC